MKKRTLKKNTFRKKKTLRKKNKPLKNKPLKISKKKSKRKSIKKQKKVLQSGGGVELNTILDILLSKDIISYIPTSQIFDYDKIDRYIRMVDVATLKDIVLENIEYKKSPTIQKIFNYTSEELKDPKKITFNPEDVNCQNLIEERNQFVKRLFLYLFECNEDTYIKKNIDWFKIICGLDEFDETYEYQCMKKLIDMGMFIKKEDILEKIKLVEENLDFKLILRKRLFNCSEIPRTFFENIFGGISFPSFNSCDKKSPEGVLYLYDEYKRFLIKDHENISKLDKVKILIYCEVRQHLLSKHIALELVRLNDKNYTHIRYLLKKIFNLDHDIIKENDEKYKKIKEKEEKEKAKKLNLKDNLENIDDKYDEKSEELTEEEKLIKELDEKKKKSIEEGRNFEKYDKETEDKINALEEDNSDENNSEKKMTGGSINPGEEALNPGAEEFSPGAEEFSPGAGFSPGAEEFSPGAEEFSPGAGFSPGAEASQPFGEVDGTLPPGGGELTGEGETGASAPEKELSSVINPTGESFNDNLTTESTITTSDFDTIDKNLQQTPITNGEALDINDLEANLLPVNMPESESKEEEDKIDIEKIQEEAKKEKEKEIKDAVKAQQDVSDCDKVKALIASTNELNNKSLKYIESCGRVDMNPFN